ncbi:MAG: cysteine--tRNA ligase [Mycoplasmataceae bacterium]|nr:cysteine--tRNA ligase [Mycoplasmataceae bacterium]
MKLIDFFSKQNKNFDKNISLYVCGPTVYNSPHIGNMRPIIIFDIFNRVASLSSKVTFVHNITDVDDKIINRSIELGLTEKEVSEKYEKEYMKLLSSLNILKPTYMPRVTEHIDGMIDFISVLINKGFAYENNGSVYFEISKLSSYGKQSGINLEKLIKITNSENKKNPKDFSLWKKTKIGIKWSSPWGDGRPGWHTECAYFVQKIFGNNGIDIHGGGIDLKFPHHINEIAQYESYTNSKMSKVWFYVGHLTIDLIKMSKSKKNFISAKDFIKEHGGNTLRMIMISTNIQKPINLNDDVITNSKNIIFKIKNSLTKALVEFSTESKRNILVSTPTNSFVNSLKNNLDFGKAMTILLQQIKELNSETEIIKKGKIVEKIIANLSLLGFVFEINYNSVKIKLKKAKESNNFKLLDELKKEIIK